jgi:hypothetical protein
MWEEAPWTLRTYVVLAVVGAAVVAILVSSMPMAARLFFVGFELVISFFLLRRVRWLWILTIAFILLGFALGVIEGNLRWYGVVQSIVALFLLLHPSTQAFFRRPQLSASTQPSGS